MDRLRTRKNPTLGVSSRRFACDRCRSMKLRCLRERSDKDARCDRCLQADVECSTSPIFHICNHSLSNHGPYLPRKRQRQERYDSSYQATYPSIDEELIANHTSSFLNNSDSISIPAASADTTSLMHSSSDSRNWDPVLDAENLALDHFSFDDSFKKIFNSVDPSARSISESIDSDPASWVAPTAVQLQVTPSSLSPPQITSSCRNSAICGDATSTLPGELGSPDSDDKGNFIIELDVRMLSKINLELAIQLAQIKKEPRKLTLDMLITSRDKSHVSVPSPVDSILNVTREFLETLRPSQPLLRMRSSETPRVNFRHLPPEHSDGDGVQSAPRNLQSPVSLPASTPVDDGGAKLDTTVFLLVLNSYVQILRLYIILFAHIQDFLQEIFESDHPCLSPVPGVDFNNISLQSGNLQVAIVIQIVVNMFERIEGLLRLPREFRINRRDGDSSGLLRDIGASEITRSIIIQEEEGDLINGKGGIKLLRKYVKKTNQLLREGIAP
ncbi:hypothetical protein F5Y04DRAFT_138304 [Hypomontagnella monticulosa]|nr:hypothetical protein F5Y04DRAFT_138304 [Hypomontagnella monticulosa]